MSQVIHPVDLTPDKWVNTYGHPSVVAKHGYGYDVNCSCCYLGHSHTWLEHYRNLLFVAIQKQFGPTYQWTSDREREMHEWELAWWKTNAPFEWRNEYRKTYSW